MKRWLIIGVLTGGIVLGACSKFMVMKGPFNGNEVNAVFVEYIVDKTKDRLDLTGEQCDQLKLIVEKMTARALQQRPEAEALRSKMADEVRKPQLDLDKMASLVRDRMQLFRVMMEEEKDDFASFHSNLTAEQKDTLAKLILDHDTKGWHGGL